MTKKKLFKIVYLVKAQDEGEAEKIFAETDCEIIKDSVIVEEFKNDKNRI